MSKQQIDYRKLSKFQTDAEFNAMMKKRIAKLKTDIDKRKGNLTGNKKIISVINTSLSKVLPNNIVKKVSNKVRDEVNANKSVKENFNNAKKVVTKEINTLMAMPKMKPKSLTKTKTKVKATAANTKDYNKTLALQKRLIAMGAKIKADGIMGSKTRAAIQKFMKKKKSPSTKLASLPKAKPSSIKADSGEGLLGTNPRFKRTKDIKDTPSKFGGRVSLSARLKEIEAQKKAKSSFPKILARLAKRKKR